MRLGSALHVPGGSSRRADLLAGLAVSGLLVPQVIAYAQIAGLPPQAGLLAAPWALVLYALLGTSRSLMVSATSSTALMSAEAVGRLAGGDAATFAALSAALAIVTGGLFLLAGAARLGGIADFISKPVLTGFLFGLGLTIAVEQVPKLLGVPAGSGTFVQQLGTLLGHLGDTHAATAVLGAATIALLLALRRWLPGVPSSLVALVAGIAVSAALDLSAHGIAVVGTVPAALPRVALPDVSLHDLAKLLPSAAGIALVGYAESITVARQSAAARGLQVDPERELLALGAANVGAGLGQGLVQAGGASQSATGERAGGRTQLMGLVCAAVVVLTGALLAPLFKTLPLATLGAIVIVAITGFFAVGELRRFARVRLRAIGLALAALVGVLVAGILPGLAIAVALALATTVQRLSRPRVTVLARDPDSGDVGAISEHPDWVTPPETLLARVEAPILYANATMVQERLRSLCAQHGARRLVLSLADNGELDLESADMLADLHRTLIRAGARLELVEVRPEPAGVLRRDEVLSGVPVSRSFATALGPFNAR